MVNGSEVTESPLLRWAAAPAEPGTVAPEHGNPGCVSSPTLGVVVGTVTLDCHVVDPPVVQLVSPELKLLFTGAGLSAPDGAASDAETSGMLNGGNRATEDSAT